MTKSPHEVTTTRFAYAGTDLWADLNSSNQLITRHFHGDGIDEFYARVDSSGSVGWLLQDRLGSVTHITNNTGSVIDQITYDSYGRITTETSPSNGGRFAYTGKERDAETNLHHTPGARSMLIPAAGCKRIPRG